MEAIVGNTGLIGKTLLRQTTFSHHYNSSNIHDIEGRDFDLVVCSGMRAEKWIANKYPNKDLENLTSIKSNLKTISADLIILISTVDVFANPIDVDEDTMIDTTNLETYGLNRYDLENFVKKNFNKYLIVRLAGLVGKNLKKNFLFDLKNNNNLDQFNSESTFQFYVLNNLWNDIKVALNNNLRLIHLTSEPLSVVEICEKINFDKTKFDENTKKVNYDFKTKYKHFYKSQIDYTYDKNYVLNEIKDYINL
tara:strand:+ start:5911 stop:6663 length:753 start_codon:yes stop_codon:yes gene_type:complete